MEFLGNNIYPPDFQRMTLIQVVNLLLATVKFDFCCRGVKFLKTSLTLIAEIFHLDTKLGEILKKNLKISHALLESLLANASGQVEFYTLVKYFKLDF